MTMKRNARLAKAVQADFRVYFEQRRFSYAGFIPERRSGKDRRGAVVLVRTGGASAAAPDRN